jgi:hypothetical protein
MFMSGFPAAVTLGQAGQAAEERARFPMDHEHDHQHGEIDSRVLPS